MKKIDYIVLSMVEPTDKNTIWAYPVGNGLVSFKVFNNGEWVSTGQTVDLTPYLKKTDAQSLYLSKSAAQDTYATKDTLTSHTSDNSNPHKVTKGQVGLGNVDNTSDADKPISTAVQEALNLKQDKTDNSLKTYNKTIVGAINEIQLDATGVGRTDGSGEIFNSYQGVVANKALAKASHAEGSRTTASGNSSHAEGSLTIALNLHEHAEGRLNVSNTGDTEDLQTRHSVGIGTSSSKRKNAHEIMANGDHYIYGLGGYDGTNAIEETSQSLQEVVNSKQTTITAGTGLEFEGNTLNVTLDTTVFKVVSALPDSPAQGDENKIHLVPAVSTGANNAYTEYVWVNSAWEILGEYTSEVDLTPYLKTADAANTYLAKTDAASTYLSKTDAASTYQPVGDYATSTELTEGLAGKQDAGSYATTTQLEALQTEVNSKADSTELPTYTTVPTLTADYNIPANATMVEKIYMITIGATVYNVTGDSAIKWAGGVTPTASANSILVVSVLNNLATWQTFI